MRSRYIVFLIIYRKARSSNCVSNVVKTFIYLVKFYDRSHEKEWSREFLQLKEDKMNSLPQINYATTEVVSKNVRFQQQNVGHEWASEYLQNVPLVETNYVAPEQFQEEVKQVNGMY